MPQDNELGLLSSKYSRIDLKSLHVVPTPTRNLVSLAEFEDKEYTEMISKLNEIVHKVFRKGAMEAGYTFATLHYTFMSKTGAEKDVGMGILNKLLVTYFQTFNSPYLYSVFIHSYIVRWFRLIVILDTKFHEVFEFMHMQADWRTKHLRIYKFTDHSFQVFPPINPDNPIIPFISTEDQLTIDDLIKSFKKDPVTLGKSFSKFYHLILTRILKEQENLKYSFEIQALIGPKIAIELNKKEIASVIEGIAEYYYAINKNFKEILKKFDDDSNIKMLSFLRKKWFAETKFSGISFSSVVREKLKDSDKHKGND
jgi:hypothetical protein